MSTVAFDPTVGEQLIRYGRMIVARGYIHNSLGNIVVRVAAPGFEHGVVYTKHAEVSLEDMTLDNVVVTDVPAGRLLHGTVTPSVGHQLSREILRLRPDINAVIHVHHDESIAFFASRAFKELRVLSLEFPYVMGRPPYVVPSHLDVEQDVTPIREFIAATNSVIMENHGLSTLGRTLPEAYHRLNTLTSEIRRNILAERLAAQRGTEVHYLDQSAVDWMYGVADHVIYPSRSGDPSAARSSQRA